MGNADAQAVEEIPLNEFGEVWFGNAQDDTAKTGVTVAIFPNGARVGVDISGGGPASRETPVILPTTAPTPVNAIVLAGGSAYGLAAADGVMRWLEENHIGFDTRAALVPIVVQSDIYDL
ncbi:MAG: P1 family peptidase, partial [Selenomonadaceae bacterium]|nr:P1 family peptidase [Selenomonadaceae bacterium]